MARETYTVHSMDDPALARMGASKIIAYGKTRKPEDLGEVEGEAVRFTFRRLSRAQLYEFVEATTVEMRKLERAFMAAVIRIEGGYFGDAWEPDGVGGRGYVSMSEGELEFLEERGLSIATFVDIGGVAYVRSMLSPKAEPLYPLQPSSLLAWDALPRPSAEPPPDGQSPSNGAHSAALA